MPSTSVFVSYTRGDADVSKAIASELKQLGQTVWLDVELSGGQQWWDTILKQIRNSDVFLFVLSNSALRSKACRAELEYAHRLDRLVLPVLVEPVIDQLLPPYLAETHRVDGANVVQLARALLALPSPPPLPEPLPSPPPVPLSYLTELADSLNRDDLSLSDQRNLLGSLKQLVKDEDEREAAVEVLRRLRRHRHVNAWVAEEIDTELARLESRTTPQKPVDPPAEGSGAPTEAGLPQPVAQPPEVSSSSERRTEPPAGEGVGGAHQGPSSQDRPPVPATKPRKRGVRLAVAALAVALTAGAIALVLSFNQSDGNPLRDDCAKGDMTACDTLYDESDVGSEDERFANYCGGRSPAPREGGCKAYYG